MTEADALLAAVVASPDDDLPRLVYADWLDERGAHSRAEFIRVQCELARLAPEDPRRGELHERQEGLLAEHRGAWLPAGWSFRAYPRERWRRGFVTRVEKQGGRVTQEDGASLAAVPTLESLSFGMTGVSDDEFRHLPPLPHLSEFSLWGSEELTPASFRRLGQWPALTTLALIAAGLTDDSLAHVVEVRGLRALTVDDGIEAEVLTDAGLVHLAGLTALEELTFSAVGVTGTGLTELAALPRLRTLEVGGCGLTAEAVAPLLACDGVVQLGLNHYQTPGPGDLLLTALPRLPRLRVLHSIRNDVTADGFAALGRLTDLEELAVGGPGFGDRELTGLLSLGRLRRLHLHTNQVTGRGLAGLAALPSLLALRLSYQQRDERAVVGLARLEQLRWLDLGHNVTDDDLTALAGLRHLEVLRFRSPFVTDAGVRRLKGLARLRHLSAEGCRVTREFAWDRRQEWAPQLESLTLNGHDYGPTEWLKDGWGAY